MLAGIFGAFLLLALVFGLFGLVFKNNREDKEYVSDVKSIGWTAFQWFVLLPVMVVVFIGVFVSMFK